METKNPKANAKLKKKKKFVNSSENHFHEDKQLIFRPNRPSLGLHILVVMCYFFVENNQI